MDIDYVVLWVDGNDPVWKKKMLHYKNQDAEQEDAGSDERFRDMDTFQYMFRALEKNTPWLHKVYVVTDGQCPAWLNRDYEKVEIVDHSQIIDSRYLPVFNSCAIEVNVHKIPGLSEHFIYGNDDTFINVPMQESDFFKNGLPRYFAGQTLMRPADMSLFTYEIYTDMILLFRNFTDKKSIRKNYFRKLFSPQYGMSSVVTNMILSLFGGYGKFLDPHFAMPMLKSTYEEVWRKEPEVMQATSSHKFRSHNDVNQYVFRYWNIASGRFEPDMRDYKGWYDLSECDLEQVCDDIVQGKNRKLCINDGRMTPAEAELKKARLVEAFEKRYPEKSSFEL